MSLSYALSCIYGCVTWCNYGTNSGSRGISNPCLFLEPFSSYWVSCPALIRGDMTNLVTCYAVFSWYTWKPAFSEGKGRSGSGEVRGTTGCCALDIFYERRINRERRGNKFVMILEAAKSITKVLISFGCIISYVIICWIAWYDKK